MRATELAGAERAAAWATMLRTWPNYAKYEERTDRTHPGLPAGPGLLGPRGLASARAVRPVPSPPVHHRPPQRRPPARPRASGSTTRSCPRTGCVLALDAAVAAGPGAGRPGLHRRPGRQGRARRLRAAARAGRAGRRRDGRPGRLGDGQPRRAGAVRARAVRRLSDDDGLPPGPGLRRRRAADHRARHQRRPATTTASCCDAQLDWLGRRPLHPGRARHDPGHAPPADPGADDGAGRGHRAARPGPARGGHRGHRRPPDPRRALPLLVVLAPSPASRSRWPRPAATPPTSRRGTG